MTIQHLIETIKNKPSLIDFTTVISVIDNHYSFNPTAFKNGDQYNKEGENSGSCKVFSFARLQKLSEQETLSCFGKYYFDEVLNNPTTNNHQNIRNFMKTGWNGIAFEGEALIQK